MASASEDGTVRAWSTETFDMVACLEGPHALRTIAASAADFFWRLYLATGDITGLPASLDEPSNDPASQQRQLRTMAPFVVCISSMQRSQPAVKIAGENLAESAIARFFTKRDTKTSSPISTPSIRTAG